jgi:cystathionine beta-lyase/cystathionine gamma-synthase
VTGGFAGNDSAALNNIETLVIDPKSTIIYSRSGNQTISPLAAYPTLLLKGSGTKTVASGIAAISPAADSVVIDTLVVLKVDSGAKVDFQNRQVIIHSNIAGTGMIGEISDSSSALLNATNVTVERFIPARRSFRFLSSPVTTTTSIRANWMEGAVNPI